MDYVHRTNLIPDPRFQHVEDMRDQGLSKVEAVDHENGHRYLRVFYDGLEADPYLDIANILTAPASYRLHFSAYAEGSNGLVRVYTRTAGMSAYRMVAERGIADGQTVTTALGPISLSSDTIVRIVPPKTTGGMIMITECNLELASTFDQAYPYFDWSTMPDPRGGGGIRPSPVAVAVRRSFWGLAA